MQSLWNENEARAAVERYAALGVGADLALRTYSARLLGADPTLVLHGGGNTSVKTTVTDLFGDLVEVLCVKGSGWDLASIEPAGHPAVRLAPLLRLRGLERLSDEDMVAVQRSALMHPAAPTPSVETLLHAFIPERFIDHTHAQAVLALADQPQADQLIGEVFGDSVACVPYVMPGFDLARRAAAIYDAHRGLQGLVLINHGIFSFGADARESYERMIALVSRAEAHLASAGRPRSLTRPPTAPHPASEVLSRLRGVLGHGAGTAWPSRWILDWRGEGASLALANAPDLEHLARRGVATPDHVIRTKAAPLVLTAPAGDLDDWRPAATAALDAYVRDYQDYFRRNVARFPQGRTPLDPLPRVIAIPGLGLIGAGRDAAEAAVAADIAQSWAATVLAAESIGRFSPVGEADTFDLEYWSLEQAKLGKSVGRPLARHVAVVTGGGGGIGRAIGRAFAAEGAEVALLDLDAAAAAEAAAGIGRRALGLSCDVTDPAAVAAAFAAVVERFGGVDIVVSNAGSATPGPMASLTDAALRGSFEINFFAHQSVAKAAVSVFRAQRMGGALLFNVSKQAINPGPDFGAYGTAKAALMALMRQYAIEHGAAGVRVNAINPDRIRSGLLTEAMIAERSAARGVDPAAYMAGNLLGVEVTPEDVAQTFVFAAMMRKTTGAVITVDGGNAAAMLR